MNFKKEVSIEVGPVELANKLARSSSEVQATFFNALAEGFINFGEGEMLEGCQMLWMKDKLTTGGKAFIHKLSQYIEE